MFDRASSFNENHDQILEGFSEAKYSLLMARYRISNAKATNVEITNTKIAMEMGIIDEVEGKRKVMELLGMK